MSKAYLLTMLEKIPLILINKNYKVKKKKNKKLQTIC